MNVTFDVPAAGVSAPGRLIYVSPSQINVQVPWELSDAIAKGHNTVQMKVTIDLTNGNVVNVPLAAYSPAFFETATGVAAALDQNSLVVSASHPATRGQVVQLVANGLGPVTNTPGSGIPAGGSPLSTTVTPPTVTIGGQTAAVSFSGLAPGFAGLYQVNVTVPSNIGTGTQPLVLTIAGVTAKASGLPVQ